jgi:hypothetical protein
MSKLYFLLLFLLAFSNAYAQFPSDKVQEDDTVKNIHIPGTGLMLYRSSLGELRFNPYGSMRYLNQTGIDNSYTDAFGRNFQVRRRNDIQLFKVILYFKGWLFDPNFNYVFYAWTSNSNMGQGAQVVLGGSGLYSVNKYIRIGGGISGLPSVRSLIGQFPNWICMDARPMAEEFFRGSFTTGVWLQGEIIDQLYYKTMLGDNLSQLGVDAGQLTNGLGTWSSSVWWTTNDFGRLGSYSDFEHHDKIATLLGAAYTQSHETKQSQPNSEDPENTLIRLSDGTAIFSNNAFNNNSQLNAAMYRMTCFYGGVKFRGFSLDLDYYMRWVNQFEAASTPLPVSSLYDNGFTIGGTGMAIDKTLELHAMYSYINGQYGKPWELITGLNYFPYKNRALRLNPEVRFTNHSPIGYLAFPTPVGGNGPIYIVNVELNY